jgi:cyclophilin type peptidyl-prolyl cis-trans isomerase/CLD
MAVGRFPPTPTGPTGEHRSVTVDALATQLRDVVKSGLINARPPDGGALADVVHQHAQRHDYADTPDDLARALRDLIHDTLDAAEPGPGIDAARALLGDTPETRIQPAAERRRIAADVLDIRPRTLRETYERRIVRDLATRLYTIHHALPGTASPPDTATSTTAPLAPSGNGDGADRPAPTGIGDVATPANGNGREASPTHHITAASNGWDGNEDDDETMAAVIALFHDDTEPVTATPQLARTGRIVAFPAAAREQLAGLAGRVPRYRWDKALLIPATAAAVWARWGAAAVVNFAGVLVIAGLLVVAAQVVRLRAGTATTAQVLYERLPRIILLALVGVLLLNLIASGGDDESAVDDPCLGLQVAAECQPSTTTATTAAASPHSVPVTFTEPQDPVAPECPPPGNTERRVTWNYPPPAFCIDPAALYVARVETNYGPFDIELNTQRAPYTVNNFVFLARWRFYDGVVLLAPDVHYLVTGDPVDHHEADQAPGYTLLFDHTGADYPDDGLYVVMTDTSHPNRFAIPVSDDARDDIETRSRSPLLGRIISCEDVITSPIDGVPRSTAAPIVIQTITIHELDPATTTTTNPGHDPHCTEVIEGIPGGSIPNPGGTP